MQTTSMLLPTLWGVAILCGLFGHNFTSRANAKFLSMRGLGMIITLLGAALLVALSSTSFPEWQVFISSLTYALSGFAGGILSFYTRKLTAR